MSFWKYCEKVEGFLGHKTVIDYITLVYDYWFHDFTVGECVDFIRNDS